MKFNFLPTLSAISITSNLREIYVFVLLEMTQIAAFISLEKNENSTARSLTYGDLSGNLERGLM